MRLAKVRLVLAVLALFAWVGYVAFQALAYGRFPVVSHAQLLVSTLDVVADVTANAQGRPEPKVHVVEVHWPAGRKDLAGQDIVVGNLTDPAVEGFHGSGRYILPLIAGKGGMYQVAGLPRSPGFERPPVFFIYPDTPLTRKQLDEAPKPPTAGPPPGR
jgi:hypothetical protein